MNPLSLDNSFVIALFKATDAHHEQAREWHEILLRERRAWLIMGSAQEPANPKALQE